jgi:RNA polymerase sigma-70 factor (ECF subfamily)
MALISATGNKPADRAVLATTHWSVVLAAGQSDCPGATEALERLCRAYWYPLYAYVRRRGYDASEAEDLTQAFFERLLEKRYPRAVDPQKGKFRSFLLASLEHFLAKEWRRVNTLKRGAGRPVVSLDADTAEDRFRLELAHHETPEKLFERRWALALLDQAMDRLGEECAAAGKAAVFEALKPLLGGERSDVSQADLAARLGMTENALNVALSRLRRRDGELVREEIAQTVAGPADVDEELRCLVAAIRG